MARDGLAQESIANSEAPGEPFVHTRIRRHIEVDSVEPRLAQIREASGPTAPVQLPTPLAERSVHPYISLGGALLYKRQQADGENVE